MALACFLTLVATGALLALTHLRAPGDLVTSAYVVVLALKVAALAAAALIALLGARRLQALALGGVLVLAALLVSLPPPAEEGPSPGPRRKRRNRVPGRVLSRIRCQTGGPTLAA